MPDWRDISVWQRLHATPEAVAAAEEVDARDAASVARLRRRFDADLVSAALELAEARRKAVAKFAGAAGLWCDVAGVEQASGERVAAWKAARFAEVLDAGSDAGSGAGSEVLDICCGIGGDAMALVAAGLRVTAVDLDPRRAWMAGVNAGCGVRIADAESLDVVGAVLHADPARRDERGGVRSWSLEDHRPGRAWIEHALREARGAGIKFSPGVDRRAFGEAAIEWEFIEDRGSGQGRDHGTLVQAVAWSGVLARHPGWTRATRVGARVSTLVGAPDDGRADRIEVAGAVERGQVISEPCASIERAQLLTEASRGCAREIARNLGLLTSPEPLDSAWFEGFRVVEECRLREDALREVLSRHGLRARSVRVRGRAADADALTKALGARPDGDAVVFAFRRGDRATSVVALAGSSRAQAH